MSEAVEWAIHCCTVLGALPADQALPAARLAEFHDVPPSYLAKALQATTAAGITESRSGPLGGYRLARPPADITYHQLGNQRFLDLEPCTLRFNFFRDQLYEIQFDCGRDAKVVRTLEREFGEPTMRESYGTFWYWTAAVLGLSQGSKVFGLSERGLSPVVHQAIARAAAAEKAAQASPAK